MLGALTEGYRPAVYRVCVVEHRKKDKKGKPIVCARQTLKTSELLTLEQAFNRRVNETGRISAADMALCQSAHILTLNGRMF